MRTIPIDVQMSATGTEQMISDPIDLGSDVLGGILDIHIETSVDGLSPVDYRGALKWSTPSQEGNRIYLDDNHDYSVVVYANPNTKRLAFIGYFIGDLTTTVTYTITGNLLMTTDGFYGFREDKSKVDLIDLIHPVGSIYMSVDSTNPSSIFGGTWVPWGSGRVPVGVDASQTEFNTVEKTGGEKVVTLSEEQIPSHRHGLPTDAPEGQGEPQFSKLTTNLNKSLYTLVNTGYAGGGQAHNNLQPYITCYMWKRTA